MQTLSISLTLKEAEAVAIILAKADPLACFTAGAQKQIDTEARKIIHAEIEKKERKQ